MGSYQKKEELGGKAVTISGPDGYVYDKDGITGEKIDFLLELRASGNNRAEDYVKKFQLQNSMLVRDLGK